MRSEKANQDEEYEDEEFGSKKEVPSSNNTTTHNNNNIREGKNSDKASVTRSKHSVTEQRRRSKINERFQILRDLIPHSEQKRDTASFLLEVIEYIQYIQEKIQKYEGSYQGWNSEPTKLMPWRNSHWRSQSFVGHPEAIQCGSGPGSTFPGKLDDNNITIASDLLTSTQNPLESNPSMDIACKAMDRQPELANKGMPQPMPLQANMPASVRSDGVHTHPLQRPTSDAQLMERPIISEALNRQEELTIEGGTISISSAYSEGLLNTLTQALQSTGVDLSQASISVQIDLGKRANRGMNSGTSVDKDLENLSSGNQRMAHFRDASSGEDSDQAPKRLKS